MQLTFPGRRVSIGAITLVMGGSGTWGASGCRSCSLSRPGGRQAAVFIL